MLQAVAWLAQSCRVTSSFDNITTQKELKNKWKRKNKYTALLASHTALQERINSIEYRIETRTTHQVRHIDIMTIATDRHQQKKYNRKARICLQYLPNFPKESLFEACSPNPGLESAQKSLGTAALGFKRRLLLSFFFIHGCLNNKIQSTGKKFNLVSFQSHALYQEKRLQTICKWWPCQCPQHLQKITSFCLR